MRYRGRPEAGRLLFVLVLLLTPARLARAHALPGARLAPMDARIVEIARQAAVRRLQSPECQRLLTDFTDADGRTLLENLQRLGMEPDAYLATLVFLDGKTQPRCQGGRIDLVTTRGAGRIFVCKPFLQAVWQRRDSAEVAVIHEMLHTLGLGEDPPTSLEITRQVRTRCAR